MTTIATDGRCMAGDGMCKDQYETIVNMEKVKVLRLQDGRIAGGSGNSFDIASWVEWLNEGKIRDCPIDSVQFAGLILQADGCVLWVDHKGREALTPAPCSIGSGQDLALGAMEAGACPFDAVAIAARRDSHTGGKITVEYLHEALKEVA